MTDFELTSPDFEPGGEIPRRHTCDGEDVAVALSWAGAPAGTAEFALVMDDPDARGFVHWLVVGIPASATELAGDPLPPGAREGRNDFRRQGYGGPCPPSGSHRYVFTLYALREPLAVTGVPTADEVRRAGRDALGQATLTGT
ncbi:MAG: YbhB/YbcL family Raf kinase inhibitor-like protein, partial [Chloroflexota bacterium]|nr:YbhB/YbcL family Raf kinase inhibitor-like protein [Chloroflexota bacterium]